MRFKNINVQKSQMFRKTPFIFFIVVKNLTFITCQIYILAPPLERVKLTQQQEKNDEN